LLFLIFHGLSLIILMFPSACREHLVIRSCYQKSAEKKAVCLKFYGKTINFFLTVKILRHHQEKRFETNVPNL